MAVSFTQTQKTSQKQVQKLNQIQIQSLKYLAMNSYDLRTEILKEVQNNPALEIINDSSENSFDYELLTNTNSYNPKDFKSLSDYTKNSTTTNFNTEKSDAFQSILESKEDLSETLSEHLLKQFNLLNLQKNQNELGKKLIYNLDKNGYHILAPISFLNSSTDTEDDLKKVISIIQNLDPIGCCCKNFEESLLIQAKSKDSIPQIALFILDGHLDFLDPPQSQKVLKHLTTFYTQEKSKSFSTVDYSFLQNPSIADVENAILFIQSLTPFPASQFSPDDNFFIAPEIYVRKVFNSDTDELEENSDNFTFVVTSAKNILPEISICSEYSDLIKNKNLSDEQKSTLEKQIIEGKNFIQSIQYREDSVLNAASVIVNAQKEFFKKGPGHLISLKQKDVAQILNLHETTISRIANSKYLECEWGVFPLKYFFVSGISNDDSSDIISKDKILFEIKNIIKENSTSKKISDQKISDLLLKKGIKVARRTVAKYRNQLSNS